MPKLSVVTFKQQVAKEMGVSKPRVSGWVNGTFPMAPNHITRSSKILAVNVETAVGWVHSALLKELGGVMGNAAA